ncbi:(2Fe-2S)-binding protein [Eubacteriales bacterium OttesenSCG-928-A19]|nr:(2Fe-2S)-binding protein [Eubacteriales bacterium OttesenSCG-928-A19]
MQQRMERYVSFTVNGKKIELSVGEKQGQMPPQETLAHTLRDRLSLTGAKIGCDQGACGCCTVIMDEKAVTSCMTFTCDCDGTDIITIEGLADAATGTLSDLQQSFIDNAGYQCGFCIPGIIMSAEALLREKELPDEDEVREALAGNYCRCGTHYTAVDSIMAFVEKRRAAK